MEFKKYNTVNEDQNIVVHIEITMTPAEFLRENGEVWNFAEAMKPGARLTETKSLEGK